MASSRTDQQIAEELCNARHDAVEFGKTISRILSEVRAAEREDRWIPASEKLPIAYRTVLGLVVGGYLGESEPFVDTVCYCTKTDPTEWRLNGYDDQEDRGVVTVSHWQPLPEPPRSRQEANHGSS